MSSARWPTSRRWPRQHGIVLTPHMMQPFPKDGRQIDELFILAAGVYNLGFIAVGATRGRSSIGGGSRRGGRR